MRAKISQREARRLQKRVAELENIENERRSRWTNKYPGGVNIGSTAAAGPLIHAALTTARKLDHAIVVTTEDDGHINFFALPIAT